MNNKKTKIKNNNNNKNNSLFMFFSRSGRSRGAGKHQGVWCEELTCWDCKFTQAALKLAQQGEMECSLSQGRCSLRLISAQEA
jgi:hypothetical protein